MQGISTRYRGLVSQHYERKHAHNFGKVKSSRAVTGNRCSQIGTRLMQVPLAAASRETYDVYVNEPTQLEEGVRKHILSVFVADESGMINRVAGVFARRGANIESLAVGLSEDRALFTIVATGTDSVISNLSRQLAKLVNVRYVEDITEVNHIERELVLIKVKAPSGEPRSDISNICDIFRARILDVGDESYTLALTGDVGKIAAFHRAVAKFGILELSRTGRIAINRGEYLFGKASMQPDLDATSDGTSKTVMIRGAGGHDVYGGGTVDIEDDTLLDEAKGGVLDATYTKSTRKSENRIISLNVDDAPGVLNQVTGVISRRGYNIQSLAVGNSEIPGMSRITLVVDVGEASIDKLIKQLYKLICVDSITELQNVPHVRRELMLIKVACSPTQRGEIFDIARIFRGNVCDISRSTVTIEIAGKEAKLRALQEILEPYGILEVARTGVLACRRDSGVDSKYLSSISGSKYAV